MNPHEPDLADPLGEPQSVETMRRVLVQGCSGFVFMQTDMDDLHLKGTYWNWIGPRDLKLEVPLGSWPADPAQMHPVHMFFNIVCPH